MVMIFDSILDAIHGFVGENKGRVKKNGKISDKCQITSYPLPPQLNNDKMNSDKQLEV